MINCNIDSSIYYGMMNIGNNPTIGNNEQSIEVHFFELNKNLYNENLEISILYYLRDEQKFSTIEDLKMQLEKTKTIL